MKFPEINTLNHVIDYDGESILFMWSKGFGECRYFAQNKQITFEQMNEMYNGNLEKWIEEIVKETIEFSNVQFDLNKIINV